MQQTRQNDALEAPSHMTEERKKLRVLMVGPSLDILGGQAVQAARLLRPGGSLLAYAGGYVLPRALAALSNSPLEYWWTLAIHHAAGRHRNLAGDRGKRRRSGSIQRGRLPRPLFR